MKRKIVFLVFTLSFISSIIFGLIGEKTHSIQALFTSEIANLPVIMIYTALFSVIGFAFVIFLNFLRKYF